MTADPWALLREAKDLVGRMEAALAAQKPSETTVRSVKVGDLEWQADVPEQKMTWAEAKAYAARLGGGWRLPTRAELLTLVTDGTLSGSLA
jgi:formylglycine-generating enzyme required for sulfatase activity